VGCTVPYPFHDPSPTGSCSCCCSGGHLNHVERSRFWFRVGSCRTVTPLTQAASPSSPLPPRSPFPFSSWHDRDSACFGIPKTAGPAPSRVRVVPLSRVWDALCVLDPGDPWGCHPRHPARAICGGRCGQARDRSSPAPSHHPGSLCRAASSWERAHLLGWLHNLTQFKIIEL